MPMSFNEDRSQAVDNAVSVERRLAKLSKINAILIDRVERSMDQQGNAFSLFQTAVALEAQVRARTEELGLALRRLEHSNEALAIARDQAERANLSKTRFLAAASHDLLQPLSAARLSVSTLSEMQASQEAEALTRQVDRALQTLEDLIKALLDISKLDAGVVEVDVETFRLDDILSVLEESLSPLAAAKRLRLRVRRSGVLVESDPALLLRILQNLVSNALRYTERGGVLIGVRRRAERCFIDVIDTGRGIVEGDRESIFEEFYRGAATGGDGHIGFGLGLAIVRRTVQTLGHSLTLYSKVGKGTTFRLAVPSRGIAPAASGMIVRLADKPSPDAMADSVVLFIEDDQSAVEATVGLLTRWSCRVLAARGANDVRTLIANTERLPDIVIADYHLDEGQTGLAAIDELRRMGGEDVPAIVLTADRSETIAARVRAAGCELMHKPFKPAALRALTARLLSQQRERSG